MDAQEMVARLNWLLEESPGPDNAWVQLRRGEVIAVRELLARWETAAGVLKDALRLLCGEERQAELVSSVRANGSGYGYERLILPAGTSITPASVFATETGNGSAALAAASGAWPELTGLPYVRELEAGELSWRRVPPEDQRQILAVILREIQKTGPMSMARYNQHKPSYVSTGSSLVKSSGVSWSKLVASVLDEEGADAGVAVAPVGDFDDDSEESAGPSGARFPG